MGSEFGGSARDVVQRAVEVLLVLDGTRDEALGAVREVLTRYGEAEASELTVRDLEALAGASAELVPVIEAASGQDAARAINALLTAYGGTPRLTDHGGTPWHLHVDESDDGPWVPWFMASTAMGLAVLMTESQEPPLGQCASPSCRRPFVRSTRGAPRRYCSTTCGTRERVAELRAARRR
jgi:hypothetical protein